MRALMGKPKVEPWDADGIRERYMWYLDKCEEFDDRPTVEGFALAMGVDRLTLKRWKDGEVKSVPEESRNMLKRAWIGMNQILAQYMADGHLNPVTAIFLLKNHFEYKDQTETVVIKKDPYETGNPEEIARKYLTGMAPGLAAPQEIAPEDKPLIETVVIDQTGTVE